MADKKGPDMVAHTKKTLLAFFLTVLGTLTAKACQDQGMTPAIYPATTTYSIGDIDIGDSVKLIPGAQIYEQPDDIIEKKLGQGKKPNIDEETSLNITKAACIGPNGEFKVYKDTNQIVEDGYTIAAYQVAVGGDIIGYVVPNAVTKQQKTKTIGAYNGQK